MAKQFVKMARIYSAAYCFCLSEGQRVLGLWYFAGLAKVSAHFQIFYNDAGIQLNVICMLCASSANVSYGYHGEVVFRWMHTFCQGP